VAELLLSRKRQQGVRPAWWSRIAIAGLLAACSAVAQAGVLSITASQAGGLWTLTVADDHPDDMCSGGLCYADFALDYNPAALQFVDAATTPSWPLHLVMANAQLGGPLGAQVLVSFLPDPDGFLATNDLFSLGFLALGGGQASVTVGARDFGPGVPPSYQVQPADITLDLGTPLPEPSSVVLVGLGLAGLAWAARKPQARPQGARLPG